MFRFVLQEDNDDGEFKDVHGFVAKVNDKEMVRGKFFALCGEAVEEDKKRSETE